CFLRDHQHFQQPLRVGGLAYGSVWPEQWGTQTLARASSQTADPWHIFDVKADLEALAHPRALVTERWSHLALHPGRAARVRLDGHDIGWLGELHPRLMRH